MKLVDISVVTEDGKTSDISINLDQIVMLVKVPIPTGLTSADGKTPMVKTGTGICLSNGTILPCRLSKEEIRDLLQGKKDV